MFSSNVWRAVFGGPPFKPGPFPTNGPVTPTAPVLGNAVVLNAAPSTVVLTYDKALDATSVPAVGDFVVSGKTVSAVQVTGQQVRLTVTPAVTSSDSVTVSYTPGVAPIRSASPDLLNAAALVGYSVLNLVNPVDVTAPVYQTAVISSATPNKIVLTFSEALSATITGTATLGNPTKTVSSQTVVGNTIEVVATTNWVYGDAPTISYPAGWVRDAAGNICLIGTNRAVTNNIPDTTAPTRTGAAVGGAAPDKIIVSFSETLSPTLTGAITVGGPARTVSSATVVGATVEVVVSAPYVNGDAPTISYPLGWARDPSGNQAVAGTAVVVTNSITDTTAPVRLSAAINPPSNDTIVLTFGENLSATLTGSVTLGGPTRTVSSATVVGSTVVIVASAPYVAGDAPTVTYPLGWVRDAAGNQSLAASAVAVTNNIAADPGAISTWADSLYSGYTPNTAITSTSGGIPAMSRPARETGSAAVLVTDTDYLAKLHRVTDTSEAPLNGSGVGSYYLRHEYSRRQAYNYDSSLRMAQSTPGFWWLYDTATNQRLNAGGSGSPPEGAGSIIGLVGDCEPFWSPSLADKDIIYHSGRGGGMVWYRRNVRTGAVVETRDFTTRVRALNAKFSAATHLSFNGEGRPSNDMRWWGMAVEQYFGNDPACLGFVMYDWLNDTFTSYMLNDAPVSTTGTNHRPNWVGSSPLGNYVLISWYVDPCAATIAAEEALPQISATGCRAYTRDFTSFRTMAVLGEHSDVALDAYGNEVYFSVSFHGINDGVTDGQWFYRRLDNGVAYELPINSFNSPDNADTGSHMSGLLTNLRPGLGVGGRYNLAGGNPHDAAVFVVELVPPSVTDRRVYRLAFTHTTGGDYWFEPHPTPNWDGTRIMFASNWGSAAGAGTGCDFEIPMPSTAFRVPGLVAVARTASPTIAGTATQGGTLTRTLGTYTGFPTPTVTGRWEINTGGGWGAVSPANTTATLVIPGGATNGTQYRWGNEIATQTGGASTSAVASNEVTVAALSAPVNTVAPAIAATSTNVALTLGNTGTWSGNPVPSYTYMWQRNTGSWVDSGITTLNATLTPVGTWRLKVSATNSQGGPIDAFSNSCTVTSVPEFVQATAVTSGLVSATLASPAAIGDTLVLAIAQRYGANPPRSVTSVTDSGDSATYTLFRSQVPGSGTIRLDLYRRVVTTAGTRSATVVLSGASDPSVALLHYRNAATAGAVNGANGTGTAGSVSATGGSVTPTGNALYISAINTTTNYDAMTPAPGWTQRAYLEFGGPAMLISDFIGSGAQNPGTTITAAGSIEWCGVNVTLTT